MIEPVAMRRRGIVARREASESRWEPDLAEVRGQEWAKRGLEIAAAGGHHLLLIGPAGAGKTMLGHRLPGLLPPLSAQESAELAEIYALAGQSSDKALARRPFRCPDARISPSGMVGCRTRRGPGEASLAHGGVLFLDDLPDFGLDAVAAVRRALDKGEVTIGRGCRVVPARFLLLAAMNPCPCGRNGHPSQRCSCSAAQVTRYRAPVTAELLDRIPLHVEVPAVRLGELRATPGDCSRDVAARVTAARAIQAVRFKGCATPWNGAMSREAVERHCALDPKGKGVLRTGFERWELSVRAQDQILTVARTIADLAGEEKVRSWAVAEAVQYKAGAWPVDGV